MRERMVMCPALCCSSEEYELLVCEVKTAVKGEDVMEVEEAQSQGTTVSEMRSDSFVLCVSSDRTPQWLWLNRSK